MYPLNTSQPDVKNKSSREFTYKTSRLSQRRYNRYRLEDSAGTLFRSRSRVRPLRKIGLEDGGLREHLDQRRRY